MYKNFTLEHSYASLAVNVCNTLELMAAVRASSQLLLLTWADAGVL